ncbi:MAG: hypothetical protein WCC87_12955 [Candidatus Korobacteraceae bacterium]
MNIEEVESEISKNLSSGLSLKDSLDKVGYAVPQQRQPHVTLSDAKGRKKKRNASADNWSAESGQIVVRYESIPQEDKHLDSQSFRGIGNASQAQDRESSEQASDGKTSMHPAEMHPAEMHPAEAQLVRALDRAESRPGWNFVPLRKFRDEILPLESPELIPSLRTDVEQKHILQSAIDKRYVLVGKVPNPKAPQFPVTTIRLNRLIPEVAAALGQRGGNDLEFAPVEIRGEPLSTTILRERR